MNTTKTPPAATGTLANPGVHLYLRLASSAQASADKLHAMYMRMDHHKDGEDACNAIWDGYWSLKRDARRLVVDLSNAGGLLFFGSSAATAIAEQMREAA